MLEEEISGKFDGLRNEFSEIKEAGQALEAEVKSVSEVVTKEKSKKIHKEKSAKKKESASKEPKEEEIIIGSQEIWSSIALDFEFNFIIFSFDILTMKNNDNKDLSNNHFFRKPKMESLSSMTGRL